ncbi:MULTISPECIES: LysE family translocator [unclassified Streptomyces]|uniref:LysE family translocator n=1 Tax=unclassified Streptomyces TaxID=2593676 RepID=UPI002DDC18FC|nr:MULTISPECIES: LysE family translocator [unclassified Streptomyces]WSA93458.1 LysE family translocator [Streptomyces sp. NBC_01795]WSB77827.1 LysE family translocator [Streptomyces sp. NBC_01775]WSS13925.1 LysE family translocator [Streptomyces sp. NBC_01186]WSS42739.1 LysE family translocator [Streptomyces sp. NBC_01187]
MAVSSIAAFLAVSVMLVMVPGADWAYAISSGLRDRSVVPAVGGLMLGYVGLTAVVVAGVAALVARTPGVLTGVTLLGAAYLLWLGVTTLISTSSAAASAPRAEVGAEGEPAARARVLKGAGVSGLNPKALMLYLALLPQFADQHGDWPLAAQIGLLGLVHMLTAGAVYLGVGTLAKTLLSARPTAARVITRLSGVAMIALGGLLLAEHLIP